MKINLKVRFRNPVFIAQLILAILTPIVGYMGITMEDLTTWGKLGSVLVEAIMNPYVLALVAVSVWNAVNDPTTAGAGDSARALTYEEPAK